MLRVQGSRYVESKAFKVAASAYHKQLIG